MILQILGLPKSLLNHHKSHEEVEQQFIPRNNSTSSSASQVELSPELIERLNESKVVNDEDLETIQIGNEVLKFGFKMYYMRD